MFENMHEGEPHLSSEPALKEDWYILTKASEMMASIGDHYIVHERTISGDDSRLVIREEVRIGAPKLYVLAAFKGSIPDPVVEFVFDETGQPEEMPELAVADRPAVAEDIEYVFRDVADGLDRARVLNDQPLLAHLYNYAVYLRDDCRMGDNSVWLSANKGFPARLRDSVQRADSRVSYVQRDYRSSAEVPEQLDVVQSILTVGDRLKFPDMPRLEIARYTPDGHEVMALIVSQSGRVDIASDPSLINQYELTESGTLTRYGVRCVMDLLFEHMSIDLSHEP